MKNQAPFLLLAATIVALSFAALTPHAYAKPVYVGVDGGNIAVGGCDRVSYFNGDSVPAAAKNRAVIPDDAKFGG